MSSIAGRMPPASMYMTTAGQGPAPSGVNTWVGQTPSRVRTAIFSCGTARLSRGGYPGSVAETAAQRHAHPKFSSGRALLRAADTKADVSGDCTGWEGDFDDQSLASSYSVCDDLESFMRVIQYGRGQLTGARGGGRAPFKGVRCIVWSASTFSQLPAV